MTTDNLTSRRTARRKEAYLGETDADENNVGSVVPREMDAMGIRNDEGVVGGDSDTPFDATDGLSEDDDATEDLNEDADIDNVGIGLPGGTPSAADSDVVLSAEPDETIAASDEAEAVGFREDPRAVQANDVDLSSTIEDAEEVEEGDLSKADESSGSTADQGGR
jgi:hypothetical protein